MTASDSFLFRNLPAPRAADEPVCWPRLAGAALALALAEKAADSPGPLVVLVPDARASDALAAALAFFAPEDLPVFSIPEREMLPYDIVSPARALTSERLRALARLSTLARGIVLATGDLALERLPPRPLAHRRKLRLRRRPKTGRRSLPRRTRCRRLRRRGRGARTGRVCFARRTDRRFPQRRRHAGAHGFVRRCDRDAPPLRSRHPAFRRHASNRIALLPAWEFPFNAEGIKHFRQTWRARFAGDPMTSEIYCAVSEERVPPGHREAGCRCFSKPPTNLPTICRRPRRWWNSRAFDTALDGNPRPDRKPLRGRSPRHRPPPAHARRSLPCAAGYARR